MKERSITPRRPRIDAALTPVTDDVALDADAESIALEMHEEHERPTIPYSAAEALDMTTSTDGSALDTLAGVAARFEEIVARVEHIEQRMSVYCGTAAAPTEYMELLLRAAQDAELSPDEREHLHRVQGYCVNELQPQITAVQQLATDAAIHHPAVAHGSTWHNLARPGGVWEALQTGKKGDQRVLSVFGLMARAHEQDAQLPLIDCDLSELPTNMDMRWVGRIDPLDPQTQVDYWDQRLRMHRGAEAWTLSKEIQRRSTVLAYELESEAERLPDVSGAMQKVESGEALDPGEQHILRQRDAYVYLSEWVSTHSSVFRDDMSKADFAYEQSRLHFAHSDPEEVLNLLNAAEIIKETNPLLFLRMMGVAQGRNAYQRQAERSDIFGSVFHLALHRSYTLAVPSARAGMKVFHDRVEQLFQLDSVTPDLLSISQDQMKQIESAYSAALGQLKEHPESAGLGAVALTGTFIGVLLPGYALRRDLEQMLNTVSLEEHDRTLHVLRTGSPREVLAAYRDLSERQKEDPDVIVLLCQRLGVDGEAILDLSEQQRKSADLFSSDLNMVRLMAKSKKGFEGSAAEERHRILFKLWETAPSKALLSNEFFADVEAVAVLPIEMQHAPDTLEDPRDRNRPNRQFRKQQEGLWKAILAHPDISQTDWRFSSASYGLDQQRAVDDAGFLAKRRLSKAYTEDKRLPIEKAWKRIFAQLSAEEIRNYDSKVFAVIPLKEGDAQEFASTLLFHDLNTIYGHHEEFTKYNPTSLSDHEQCRVLQRALTPEEFVHRYGPHFVQMLDFVGYIRALPHEEARELLTALCDPDTQKTGLSWTIAGELFVLHGIHKLYAHGTGLSYGQVERGLEVCDSLYEAEFYLARTVNIVDGRWQSTLLQFAHAYGVHIGDASERKELQLWSVLAFKDEYVRAARQAEAAQYTKDFPYTRLSAVMGNPQTIHRELFRLSPEQIDRVNEEVGLSLAVYRSIRQECAGRDIEERQPGHIYLQPGSSIDKSTREWYEGKRDRMREYVKTLPAHMTLEREAAQKELDFLEECLGKPSAQQS